MAYSGRHCVEDALDHTSTYTAHFVDRRQEEAGGDDFKAAVVVVVSSKDQFPLCFASLASFEAL